MGLLLSNGAKIISNPWNGIVSASAPEPASLLLLGSGLLGLGALQRRRHGVLSRKEVDLMG